MTVIQTDTPWEDVRQHIASGDATGLLGFLNHLGPAETARAVSRLTVEEHSQMLTLLPPTDAAEVIEEIPEAQAVDLS
jgi:magnesium transporter